MIFDQITLENFGVYRNKQEVILSPPSKDKPVILLEGVNGTGKTTFLDALQLALYGKYARCSNRGNLKYEDFLRRSINWESTNTEKATLEVKFRHTTDGKENEYKVTRSWMIKDKSVKENILVEFNGESNLWLTDIWHEYIESLLPIKISNLFFFDGEKIESLADLDQSADFLRTAIKSLLGIDLIDKLTTDLIVLERRKKINLKKTVEKLEIEELQQEIDLCQKKLEINYKQLDVLEAKLAQLYKTFSSIEDNIRLEGGELLERQKELESAKTLAEIKVEESTKELEEIAAGVAPLLLLKELLVNVHKQAEEEEKTDQNKVLNALIEQRDKRFYEMISNLSVEDSHKSEIEEWLQNDRKSYQSNSEINAYLNLSKETKGFLINLSDNVLSKTKSHIIQKLSEHSEKQSVLVDQERNLAAVPDPESLSHLVKKRDDIRNDLIDIQSQIKVIEIETEKLHREEESKKNKLTDLIRKKSEFEFNREDQLKISKYSEKSRTTLEVFRHRLIQHHILKIENLVLESLNTLFRKENYFSKVLIDSDSFKMTLFGKNGKIVPNERLSAGERQLLAVSILWGLAKASGQSLPAVIDTPMGRLDSIHRSRLVENYFPYVSHQVLLLSTDEEISKNYFKKLKPWIGRSYNLDFDYNEGTTQINPKKLQKDAYAY